MKPVYVNELSKEAQDDIRKRLDVLERTFGEITKEDVEDTMNGDIRSAVHTIEWMEWLHYGYDLELYVDDGIMHQHMLDEFSRYQEIRRKKYGYDY